MRHLGWFSVVLLALSCSVDNSNLNIDAGGTGTGGAAGVTGTGGSAGATGTGGAAGDGCPRCAPTGGTGGGATGGGVILALWNVHDLCSGLLSSIVALPAPRSIVGASAGSGSFPLSQRISTRRQPDTVRWATV